MKTVYSWYKNILKINKKEAFIHAHAVHRSYGRGTLPDLIELLEEVITILSVGEKLPDKNKDHALTGNWVGHRECHILPDWLLVYCIEDEVLVLTLTRTGTHSDLFGK